MPPTGTPNAPTQQNLTPARRTHHGRKASTTGTTVNRNTQSGGFSRITMLTQFDARIADFEQQYGIQLCCEWNRNTNLGQDGDSAIANGWMAEAWYFRGPTRITTSATGSTLNDMINGLLHNLSLTLQEYAVTNTQVRRTA